MIDVHLKIEKESYDFFLQLVNKFNFVRIESDTVNDNLNIQQKDELDKRYNELETGKVTPISYSEFEKLY